MTKSLIPYKRNLPAKRRNIEISSTTLIIAVVLAGLVIYLLLRNRMGIQARPVGQYTNKEEWNVQYNIDGLPTKIIVHRDAKHE